LSVVVDDGAGARAVGDRGTHGVREQEKNFSFASFVTSPLMVTATVLVSRPNDTDVSVLGRVVADRRRRLLVGRLVLAAKRFRWTVRT